jgi:hypothetical protein
MMTPTINSRTTLTGPIGQTLRGMNTRQHAIVLSKSVLAAKSGRPVGLLIKVRLAVIREALPHPAK